MSASAHPDRKRWLILFLLFLSIAVNLLDRQVLSVLSIDIRAQFSLSAQQYSYIVTAFLIGLTLAQVPAGLFLDRRGPRIGLPVIMAIWSLFNGLHAVARSLWQFCAFRFLMGVGECGNYSAGVKVISQWFPAKERALAGGLFNSGTVLGSFIAPAIIILISRWWGWQMAFVIPSLLGLLWMIPWLMFYEERSPQGGSAVREPFLPLLSQRKVWGAMLMRALAGPVVHFYWYWLPAYLQQERHFDKADIAAFAGIPSLFAGLGNIAGGWFAGWLMSRGFSLDRSRKTAFVVSIALAATSVIVPIAPGRILPLALICLATFGLAISVANHIGLLGDLFASSKLAAVTGLTGLCEGVVNIGVQLTTGYVVDHFGFGPIFAAAGLMPALAVVCLFVLIRRVE